MDINIEFARKTSLAYNRTCKSLCQELKLPQTAFDILMFLANNPEFCTARDIVEVRKLKANLVSVNVDKLVCDGYLERHAIESDRRKTELLCTEKAQPRDWHHTGRTWNCSDVIFFIVIKNYFIK